MMRAGDPDRVAVLVAAALREDVGTGDVTSELTIPPGAVGTADVVSRAAGIICGLEVAERVFEAVDAGLLVVRRAADGDAMAPGDRVLEVRGRLRSILTAERTALNFLGRLSGVASCARRFVDAVRGTGCGILDTRKTTPGWRGLEKYATSCGGATNHRAGLWDMVLIKENHVRATGGIRAALAAVSERAGERGLSVEIEVTSLEELDEALPWVPDRILLDNMTIGELTDAVARVRMISGRRPELEASGGVTLATVREIAATGVDFVSVGALTHSAPVLDLSLLLRDG